MIKDMFIALACIILMACNDKKERDNSSIIMPKATTADSIKLWVAKLSNSYDPRKEFDKVVTRFPKINTEVIKNWVDSLGKIKMVVKKDATELAIFLPRYDCIWNKDTIDVKASPKMLYRIMILPSEKIKLWKDKLEKIHKNGISNLWVAGFMASTDRLFSESGYQENQAKIIFNRFNWIPQISIDTLASILKTAKIASALDIAQEDYLFNNEGFRQQVFFTSIDSLKRKIENTKPK